MLSPALRRFPVRAATLAGVCVLLGLLVTVSVKIALAATVAIAVIAAGAVGSAIPFWLLVVGIVYQAPIGSFSRLTDMLLVEAVVPLSAVGVLLYRSTLGQTEPLSHRLAHFAPGSRWVRLGVVAYTAVILIEAARVYLAHSYAYAPGTNRDFYDYAIAIGCYALAAHYFARGVTVERFVVILFRLSLLVTVVGLVATMAHLPLYLGNLRYSVYNFTSGAVRVGFLEDVSIFGLAAVAAGISDLRTPAAKWASGIVFAAGLYLSGGRAAAIGLVGAVALWLLLAKGVKFFFLTAAIAVALFFAAPALSTIPQVQRLTNVNAAQLSADGRTLLYHDQLQAFYANPIIGTGVGVPANVVAATPQESQFYNAQLEDGGHTTYTSLLKNMGLAGFLPYMLALAAVLVGLLSRMRRDRLASFLFISILALAIAQFGGGNGSDPAYFVVLAAGAALLGRPMEPNQHPISPAEEIRPTADAAL